MKPSLEPAPLMPMEPGDPLELTEANALLLQEIQQNEMPAKVLSENAFPWLNLFLLIVLLLLLPKLYSRIKEYQAGAQDEKLTLEEGFKLLEEAKRRGGSLGLDLLHRLAQSFPAIPKEKALQLKTVSILLEMERYRGGTPDPGTEKALYEAFKRLLELRV